MKYLTYIILTSLICSAAPLTSTAPFPTLDSSWSIGTETPTKLTMTHATKRTMTVRGDVPSYTPPWLIMAPDALTRNMSVNFDAAVAVKTEAQMWDTFTLPADWVGGSHYTGILEPTLAWNQDCLITWFENYTAFCQLHDYSLYRGQIPYTLLTRRHAYARGHSFGADGTIKTDIAGDHAFFCTEDNTLVTATVKARMGFYGAQLPDGHAADFTIILFDADVPTTIDHLEITKWNTYYDDFYTKSTSFTYDPPWLWNPRHIGFNQYGNVALFVAGFSPWNSWLYNDGDSGSPDMLYANDKLIMYAGRTTSGLGNDYPVPATHGADTWVEWAIKELNTWDGLSNSDPDYLPTYADLSEFGL